MIYLPLVHDDVVAAAWAVGSPDDRLLPVGEGIEFLWFQENVWQILLAKSLHKTLKNSRISAVTYSWLQSVNSFL